jgi:PAS domain S-box-containing protein
MTIIPTLYDILTGICISILIIHLISSIYRRDKGIHISLVVLSIMVMMHVVFQKQLYLTDSLSAFINYTKIDMVSLSLTGISLAWFVYFFSKDRGYWAALSISTVYIAMLVVNLLSPNSILFGEVISLKKLHLPWGESITFAEALPNLWHFLIDFAILILITYMIFSAYRLFKGGQSRIALVWLILIFLVAFSMIWDYLTINGFIESPYLMPFTLVIFAIAMSLHLVLKIIDESRITDEILEKERRWQTLFENVNLIVVGLNRMGSVDYVNPYFCEFTEYGPEEVIGKDWFDNFVPGAYAYDVQGAFLEVLKNDFHPHYENPIVTKSGEEKMISWYNVRLTDLRGKIIGSFSIGADITVWCEKVKDLKSEKDEGKDEDET